MFAITVSIWVPDSLTLPAPVHVAIGWSFIAAGLIAWARRPENRTGLLMTVAGLVWFGRDFDWWHPELTRHVDGLATNLFFAVLAHLLVVFPDGRARSRAERGLVGSAYALATVGYVLAESSNVANGLVDVVAIGVALAILVHLGLRWPRRALPAAERSHQSSGPGRRCSRSSSRR